MSFTHLHCHTDYSLLDGVGRSIEYAELAERYGHKAMAITDHGNLYGIPAHFRACKERGIKPIAGCEFYANDNRGRDADTIKKGTAKREALEAGTLDPTFTDAHLIVLAQSQAGWQNLLKLNHDSVLNGYYYQPRTTHQMVLEHSDGLVATTACIGSAFGTYARLGKIKELRDLMGRFRDAMPGRFFCELHFNEMEEQKKVNDILIAAARDLKVPLTVALDVHYACQQDSAHQQEMVGVSRRQKLTDPKIFQLNAKNLFYADERDVNEIAKRLGYRIDPKLLAKACDRTTEVAASCNADIYTGDDLKPPRYINAQGKTITDPMPLLRERATEGFKEFFGHIPRSLMDGYIARFKHELAVIETCRMPDFYLVTADVTDFCRANGILCWVRGSGCASLIARCLGITDIDPVRRGLFFERFVDPNRPNAPDFDMDIDNTRREEVISWFIKKYGGANGERVARICAIATFGLKSAIRDLCFVHSAPSSLDAALSKAADKVDRQDKSIEINLSESTLTNRDATVTAAYDALERNLETKHIDDFRTHSKTIRSALEMVGRVRGRGLHAAGYVVGPGPLIEHLPIDRALHPKTKEPIIISAWGEGQASQDIGPTGLMKLDFLGLDTLAVLAGIARDIKERHGGFDVLAFMRSKDFRFDDHSTLEQLASGNGFGLHQFGSTDQGLARLASTLMLRDVEDVIALVALYRPGSLEFAEDFRLRSTGRAAVPQNHPAFDAAVAPTYGILVYQEQIMRVLHEIGGIPLREAYDVVKAISKKRLDKIQKSKAAFIAAAPARGMPTEAAAAIFAIIEKFAQYGFNKAHSASYGELAYRTAFVRSRYPLETYKNWLDATPNETNQKGGLRKIQHFLRAAEHAKIKLLHPRVGVSTSRWRYLKNNGLLAPLSIVAGIGEKAADLAHEARTAKPWRSVYDFFRWAEQAKGAFNSKAITSAAKAGALAEWVTRCQAVGLAETFAEIKPSKVTSRAERLEGLATMQPGQVFRYVEDDATAMTFETDALGFAYWVNPWSIKGRAAKVARLTQTGAIARCDTRDDRSMQNVPRPYLVTGRVNRKDKRQNMMAFLELSSPSNRPVRALGFSGVYHELADVKVGGVYLLRGTFESTANDAALLLSGRGRHTQLPTAEDLDDVELAK